MPLAALLEGPVAQAKKQSAVIGRVAALLEAEPADEHSAAADTAPARRGLRAVVGVLRGRRGQRRQRT